MYSSEIVGRNHLNIEKEEMGKKPGRDTKK